MKVDRFSFVILGVILVLAPRIFCSPIPEKTGSSASESNVSGQPEVTANFPAASSLLPNALLDTGSKVLPEVEVTAISSSQRQSIDPSLGTRVYKIDTTQIQNLPQGADTPFDQLVERTPGVSQDAYGSWHIRGEDVNTAYQINGIRLPQGIVNSTFGEKFDTRFIRSVSLIDGAVPAQYGINTAGIFDIQTKTGSELQGGEASLYSGSYDTIHPSFSYGGVSGKTDYFFQGSFNHNDLGIENSRDSTSAIHDETNQYRGFAYLSSNLDETSQLTFIFSGANADFQIPNTPGVPVAYTLPTITNFSSSDLNETQNEQFHYGIVSYKKTIDDFQLQTSVVNSYSSTLFRPDNIGDLMINGLASRQNRSLLENTIQNDVTYTLNDDHTLRAGAYFTTQAQSVDSSTEVFQTDPASGAVTSNIPETITDGQYKRGYLYGFYLQDQWKAFEHFTVNYGARFDESDEYMNENQISPRLNLVYEATPQTTLHLGYARLFTPPQLEYLSSTSLQKYVNTTNAQSGSDDKVPAERANYYDAGVTQQVTKEWQLGMEGYYKSIRNYVDEAQVGDSLIYTPFSYAYGYYVGTELTSTYSKDGFNTYTNVGISQAKARNINSSQFLFSQDQLDYTAQNDIHVNHDQFLTISTGSSYTFLDTTVHVDAIFSNGYYDGFANMNKVPSHCPVSFGVEHHFKFGQTDSLSVRFDVVNVFDQSYVIHHGDGIGTTAPYYGERRGFFGGVTYEF